MRIAIIGSRTFGDGRLLDRVMSEYRDRVTLIVSGGAAGADMLGAGWADRNGIEKRIFLPVASDRGRGFHVRNRQIVDHSDLIVAFWDGFSTGTQHTLNYARKRGVPMRIVRF